MSNTHGLNNPYMLITLSQENRDLLAEVTRKGVGSGRPATSRVIMGGNNAASGSSGSAALVEEKVQREVNELRGAYDKMLQVCRSYGYD